MPGVRAALRALTLADFVLSGRSVSVSSNVDHGAVSHCGVILSLQR